MSIRILFTLCFFIVTICRAEKNVKIYYEKIENGYNIFADNREHCPMSIKIDFEITNMKVAGGNGKVYLIEPMSTKSLLTKLTVATKGKAYKFSYKYLINFGNHNKRDFDSDFVYHLPYEQTNSFEVYQGYNGDFSHQNKYAIDFTMPIGTTITAIRGGIVIRVVHSNTKNCPKEECRKYNNKILIYHPDGTFAEYAHIKQNGSEVEVGDTVRQGQVIGYSGNVGWTTGPHLHLEVFRQSIDKRITIKTKFKTLEGETTELLKEKQTYLRDY